MKRYDTETKRRAKEMYDAGASKDDVSRRFGVPGSTLDRWLIGNEDLNSPPWPQIREAYQVLRSDASPDEKVSRVKAILGRVYQEG